MMGGEPEKYPRKQAEKRISTKNEKDEVED